MLPATMTLLIADLFPRVRSITTTDSPPKTAHVINIPGVINAGDLLICVAATAGLVSLSAGWTGFDTISGSYRVASATGADALTITLSGSYYLMAAVYLITGYVGTPQGTSVATSAATTHDPPPLSPSWGLKNTLWIVQATSGVIVAGGSGFNSFPPNYTNAVHIAPPGTVGYALWTARRKLRAATEDPGPLTSSEAVSARVRTIAVQGAG